MNDRWLSLNDVIDLTGWQPDSVRRLAREGHVQSHPWNECAAMDEFSATMRCRPYPLKRS